MPALARHAARSSPAAAWGRLVARHHRAVLAAWLGVFAVAAYFAAGTPRLLSAAGFETDTPARRAADILRADFPERRAPDVYVVFHSRDRPVADPAYQAELDAWRADLLRLTAGLDATVPPPLPGRDGRTAALVIDSNLTPDHFIELARQAAAIQHPGPATAYLGGLGPVYNDFLGDSESDLRQSELVSLPLAALLLLLVFGGVVAGALPVLTGLACVTVAVALLGAAARVHTVSVFALNISSALGIGLGIDYSLLVVNRFREEMRGGAQLEEAVATTVRTAGVATAVSGATVLIGFGSLLLTRLNVLWSIGLGGAIVVGVSIVSSLTLIPALLAVFGRHLDRLTLPFARGRDTRRFWHGLASGVMRRRLPVIALVVVVVALLASPARALRPGVVGAESLPPSEPAVTAQRLAEEQVGFARYPPILVVAEGVNDRGRADEIELRLRGAARGLRVTGPSDLPDPQQALYLRPPVAVFEVAQAATDNSPATHAELERLRAVRVRGVTLVLGGEAAAYQDFLNVLAGDFPRALATVLAGTLILLGLAFRSLVLPLKAVLMNLLSIAAAMGVLTWGFQEGHLASVLQFQRVGFVDATIPIVIFAALFGISMDYEVFLLARVREEYLGGLDNAAAVATGMERTGQIITSAALILVVVAATLAFSHLALNKALGVTFAVAILLDATLIRLLLVPALMRILGDLNWWPGARR